MKTKLEVDVVRIPVVEDFLARWKAGAIVFYQGIIKKFEEFFVKQSGLIEKRTLSFTLPHEEGRKLIEECKREWYIYWAFEKRYYSIHQLLFPLAQRDEKLSKFLDKEVDRKRLNLVSKVQEKVGMILDASDLKIGVDNEINGVIKGEKGSVELRTIYAGGYNIQCLHYRMLLKEVLR